MPPRPKPRWGLRHWLLASVLVLVAAAALAGWVAWEVLQRSGRTPTEVLDYLDKRMLGHPKVEWLAAPGMAVMRRAFDAQPLKQRLAQGFDVPPPPPRRGAGDISPPDPVPLGTKVWRVSPAGPLFRIADAARLAQDGDIVEIEAGDYHGDVASWRQRRLVIRGVNGAVRIFAAGRIAEGKAIWVFKRGDFDISNIDFIGAKARDGNGAGIRLESGHIRVRHCLFWNNETGLMTANASTAGNSRLVIEHSEFAYSRNKGIAHHVYAGTIDQVHVVASYFHHGSVGHLLKSRARLSDIRYNRFTDESGGRASYELDFPNGGQVLIVGNFVQQQQLTENGIMISYGEEGYRWQRNDLVLSSNTLVNDQTFGGAFLRVAPGPASVVTRNNLLVGRGAFLASVTVSSDNDQRAQWPDLLVPSRQDYRLRSPDARFTFKAVSGQALEQGVEPTSQYVHPRQVRPLAGPPQLVGADQRLPD